MNSSGSREKAQKKAKEKATAQKAGALEESISLYRLIFQQSSIALVANDPQGCLIEVNEAFATLLGYQKDEMTGIHLSQLSHPDDFAQEKAIIDEVYQKGSPLPKEWRSYEKRFVRKDGETISARITVALVQDREKKPLFALGIVEDISGYRKTEEALKASRERYRMMLHASIDGFTIVDREGLFWEVNDSYCHMVRYAREELLTMALSDVEVMDSPEKIKARMMNIITTGSGRFTARHRRKDGVIIDIEVSVTFDRFKNFFVSFIRDITDRRRAKEALKASRASFHNIVEKSDHGIIVVGLKGRIQFVNPSAARLLGRGRGTMIGKDLGMPLHINTHTDIEISTSAGEIGPGEMHVITTEWHEKPAYLVMIRDITQRKTAQKALHRRLQLEHMLAGLSSRLIGPQDIRQALEDSLALIRETLNGDRVLVGFFSADGTVVDSIFESRRSGIQSVSADSVGLSPDALPYWFKTIFDDVPVIIVKPEDMPDYAVAENEMMETRGVKSLFMLPVHISHKHSGFLSVSYLSAPMGDITDDDIAILQTAADIIGTALSVHTTSEDLRRSREELRLLTARLESIREEERSRIAREIHDELGQNLTALRLEIGSLLKKLPRPSKQISDKVGAMRDLVDTTIKSVKRISSELRPRILDDLGLVAAIQWLIKDFQSRTEILCECTLLPDDVMLGKKLSTTLFRICQEALTNIARHSKASRAAIVLKKSAGRVELEVSDNGIGISDGTLENPLSLGILGIRERVSLLGGTVTIHGDSNRGTTLNVSIPLPESEVHGDESAHY